MIRNLRVPLDLGEASKPAPVRSTRLGQGRSQAAALEPGMVTHLLGVLEYTAEHAHWPILLAAAAMVFGLVRLCHLQRSYLIGAISAIMIFWCYKRQNLGMVKLFAGGVIWPLMQIQPFRFPSGSS